MHKNNPFSLKRSLITLFFTLSRRRRTKQNSQKAHSRARWSDLRMEKHECARAVGHTIFMIFFFLQHVSVCVWCFSKQKFSVIFHMFEASLFCTLSHRERFSGGFKSCHISHFFSYKNTCVSCLLVCVCVCVWYVFGIGFLVLFVLFLLVSWFGRPQNFQFFQGRVTMALLC